MSGDKTPRGRQEGQSGEHRRSGTPRPFGRSAKLVLPEVRESVVYVVSDCISEQAAQAVAEKDVPEERIIPAVKTAADIFIDSLRLNERAQEIREEEGRLRAETKALAAETGRVAKEDAYYRSETQRPGTPTSTRGRIQEKWDGIKEARRAATPKRVRHDQTAFDRLRSDGLELSTLQNAAPKIVGLYEAADPAVRDVPFQVIEAEMKRLGAVSDGISTRDKALAVLRMQVETIKALEHYSDHSPEGLAFLREQLASQFAAALVREAAKPKRDQYQFSRTLAPGQEMYFLSLETLVKPEHMFSDVALKAGQAAQRGLVEAEEAAGRMDVEAGRVAFEERALEEMRRLNTAAFVKEAADSALRVQDADAYKRLIAGREIAALELEEAKGRSVAEAALLAEAARFATDITSGRHGVERAAVEAEEARLRAEFQAGRAVFDVQASREKRELDANAAVQAQTDSALRVQDADAYKRLIAGREIAALELEEAKGRSVAEAALLVEAAAARAALFPAYQAGKLAAVEAEETRARTEAEVAVLTESEQEAAALSGRMAREEEVVRAIESSKDLFHTKIIKPVAKVIVGGGGFVSDLLTRRQRIGVSGTHNNTDSGFATVIIRKAIIKHFAEKGLPAFQAFMANDAAIAQFNTTMAAALQEYRLKREGTKVCGARSFGTIDTVAIADDGSITVTQLPERPGADIVIVTASPDGRVAATMSASPLLEEERKMHVARVQARMDAQAAAKDGVGRK